MKRRRSLFNGSRLYRQAQEGSLKILKNFSEKDSPFDAAITAIIKKDSILITDVEDSHRMLILAEEYASALCKSVSPYLGIPIILQAITDYYYGGHYGKYSIDPFWLGTALKTTLALVGRNVYTSTAHTFSRSLKSITEAIVAAGLLDLLRGVTRIYDVFGDGTLEINGSGIAPQSPEIENVIIEFNAAFRKRGLIFRTLIDTTQAIWLQETMLDAIENVLNGEPPCDQKEFSGTFFEKLPSNIPVEFWLFIWVYLSLFLISKGFRLRVVNDMCGVSIFEKFGTFIPKGANRKLAQAIIKQVFWSQKWYSTRIKENAHNMIVERPIIRLRPQQSIFATSPLLIGEALNWFIEASKMHGTKAGGVQLPDEIFKKFVSEPFETKVCEVLRQYGFIAGTVNDSGVWLTGSEAVILHHKYGEKFPGEIDVLAYHETKRLTFVCECKVLGLPDSTNRLRNLVLKIGPKDSDGFHSKLQKKVLWIQHTKNFPRFFDKTPVGFLILDRIWPGIQAKTIHCVCDLESFDIFLK